MDEYQIVPDIVDTIPTNLIEITYITGAKVELGKELTPFQVKNIPSVIWKADPSILYTLLMTDPDSPSRAEPTNREIRHWLIINIPGNTVLSGQVLVDYRGPRPPKDSGLHRYVFLVFPQRKYIERTMYIASGTKEGRRKTSTRKLMEEFELNNPIAGNLFQAQYDDYVGSLTQVEVPAAPAAPAASDATEPAAASDEAAAV